MNKKDDTHTSGLFAVLDEELNTAYVLFDKFVGRLESENMLKIWIRYMV